LEWAKWYKTTHESTKKPFEEWWASSTTRKRVLELLIMSGVQFADPEILDLLTKRLFLWYNLQD
jgi:predicted protein tyrosine phosphatase